LPFIHHLAFCAERHESAWLDVPQDFFAIRWPKIETGFFAK